MERDARETVNGGGAWVEREGGRQRYNHLFVTGTRLKRIAVRYLAFCVGNGKPTGYTCPSVPAKERLCERGDFGGVVIRTHALHASAEAHAGWDCDLPLKPVPFGGVGEILVKEARGARGEGRLEEEGRRGRMMCCPLLDERSCIVSDGREGGEGRPGVVGWEGERSLQVRCWVCGALIGKRQFGERESQAFRPLDT